MDTEVRNNAERSRYELLLDGSVIGIADYRVEGDKVIFPHTVIDPDHRGRGLGEILVQGALDDVRPTGRTVVPYCWFVAEFIDANADYADLLTAR
jgi:predicted GNAT family acetyltransferase